MKTSEIREWAIETKRRLEQEIRSQIVAELRRETEAAFRTQLEGEMRRVIEREIRARVAPEIEREVRRKATDAAVESLKSDPREIEAIKKLARERVLVSVRDEIDAIEYARIRAERMREIHDAVLRDEEEMRHKAEEAVRSNLQVEATEKIFDEMRDKAYSAEVKKIEEAFRAEFEAKFRRLRQKLKEEVEAEFRQDVIAELAKGLTK